MYPAGTVVAPAAAPAQQATSRVEKATSHLLMGPALTPSLLPRLIPLCLRFVSVPTCGIRQTKDVVKAVKKRLRNKDPKVQFYALTMQLLEKMMKNYGEYVQSEVFEQHVLQEMVKTIQKKNDMQVRDKAYLEVKRTGVAFPRRLIDAPPIFTPPATHNSQTYGSPKYAAGSMNERMSTDGETLSLGDLNNIRNVTELLNDMVHALNPSDLTAVKDEIITDLVSQCRSNQQKLMQFVSSTGSEQLLKQGLEINDRLQTVLSKYDAMVSGTHLPVEAPARETVEAPRENPAANPNAPPVAHKDIPDEEEEDEFARLAQRKNKSVISDETSSSTGDLALVPIDPASSESSSSVASNALVPLDPAPVSSSTQTKEQDMINLLSLTLCSPTDDTSTDSSTQSQNGPQQPAVTDGQQNPSDVRQYPSNYQPHPTNLGYTPQNSNYVAPWAQTGAYPAQPLVYASGYPAPPWATPPGINSNPFQSAAYQEPHPPVASVAPAATYAAPSASYTSPAMAYVPPSATQPMQRYSSVGSPPTNGLTVPQAQMKGYQQPKDSSAAASKPYYIPDNLFSDLIDLKSLSGGNKMGGPTSLGSSNGNQPMIGGKK